MSNPINRIMENQKSITLEIYPPHGKTITINGLSNAVAQEYFMNMTPDSKYQFFRIMEDDTRREFNYRLTV